MEVAAPIYQQNLKERIQNLFDLMLRDNRKARQEGADGIYRMVENDEPALNSQEALYQLAYDRIAGQSGKASN